MELAEMQVMIDGAVETAVDRAIQTLGLLDPTRKFTPGEDGEIEETEGKFKSFGEFLYNVKYRPDDARLKSGLTEGTDTAGGFLVPEEFVNKLLLRSLEASVIRPNAPTIIPMSSDTLLIPKIVDTSHSSSVYGGVVAYWTEEAGSKTVKEPTFGQIKLIAKKLTGYTYASDELLADSAIALESLLLRLFGEALAWYEDLAFLDGSGVGEPLGLLNSSAYLCVNRSAANTIALADLANIWARLYPASHGRAIWIANPAVLPQLVALASTTLTWLKMDQGLAKAPPATLLGRPIYFTEKVPTLGTCGDISLVDLSYYIIGDRQKITIDSSKHIRFLTDETAWRFVHRVDGQPWVDSAFTPKNGSTLSPFVGLYTATSGGD